jgi:hypothetical protein
MSAISLNSLKESTVRCPLCPNVGEDNLSVQPPRCFSLPARVAEHVGTDAPMTPPQTPMFGSPTDMPAFSEAPPSLNEQAPQFSNISQLVMMGSHGLNKLNDSFQNLYSAQTSTVTDEAFAVPTASIENGQNIKTLRGVLTPPKHYGDAIHSPVRSTLNRVGTALSLASMPEALGDHTHVKWEDFDELPVDASVYTSFPRFMGTPDTGKRSSDGDGKHINTADEKPSAESCWGLWGRRPAGKSVNDTAIGSDSPRGTSRAMETGPKTSTKPQQRDRN